MTILTWLKRWWGLTFVASTVFFVLMFWYAASELSEERDLREVAERGVADCQATLVDGEEAEKRSREIRAGADAKLVEVEAAREDIVRGLALDLEIICGASGEELVKLLLAGQP